MSVTILPEDPYEAIEMLRQEMQGGWFSHGALKMHQNTFSSCGFLRSHNVIEITCKDSLHLESPALVAAPKVHLLATNVLELGNNEPDSVHIYAPHFLELDADHIILGNVHFIETPTQTELYCKKLSVYTLIGETDRYKQDLMDFCTKEGIEVVKHELESWDDMPKTT